MAVSRNVSFVEWEEHIICHERGNRVVHYYLKNALGQSLLAVIGTERSVRHMIYVVSDGFLVAYGTDFGLSASTKWRARREVVDWLAAMVSRDRGVAGVDINDSTDSLGSLEAVTGLAPFNTYLPEHVAQRRPKVEKASIDWSGVALICAKQLKHYPLLTRNGTAIPVHSFVFILAEEEQHYLGYLEDMYEDRKGKKKVKVRWFYRSQEVNTLIPQLNPHPREVVITSNVQVISAECIDSSATVLTPWHYEKYVAVADLSSPSSSPAVHMCFRQLKNNKLKPFALAKLNGYSNQSIVASLGECDDQLAYEDVICARANGKRKSTSSNVAPGIHQPVETKPALPKLKFRLSRRTTNSRDSVAPQLPSPVTFKADDEIELLCEDSGIRGCWFRCKVLEASKRRLKVQYIDVLDEETSSNLEEWVPATEVAAPDKLGIRHVGRQRVRPPPPGDLRNCTFEVGAPIDSWWCDGWWEGVVSAAGNDRLQVYLPGEGRSLSVGRKHVRISRDWVENRWVDVKPKTDIVDYLSLNMGCNGRLKTSDSGGDARYLEQKVVPVSSEQERERFPSSSPLSDEMQNLEVISVSKDAVDHKDNFVSKAA
ncbi:unnamed protein product [Linum tenue]|uniref:BAH domain-containing protein n=1 Tax=Linum tenue TaxID=586396 RepID=A0AAV0M2F7_9ROSI|nr:unnamed protein product [Linum tenue]